MSNDRAAVSFYVARLPEDGGDPINVTDRILSFQLTDTERGMEKIEMTVDNYDLANFDEPTFETGARFQISWGNGRVTAPIREMSIRKVSGGTELRVEGVSRGGAILDTIKRRRRFDNVTRSEVVRLIAKEAGFREPDIEDTTQVYPSISQSNLTDGQLIRKLATLEGFEFYVDADGLHWHNRRLDQTPVREYIYFTDPRGGEILGFHIDNDITRRPGRVTVKSRDPKTKKDIEASASNDEYQTRQVLADQSIGLSGEAATIDFRQEYKHEVVVASNDETEEEATKKARGLFRRSSQGAVKMSLNIIGDPSLRAKTIIELKGMGKRVSGKYYVKEVRHKLDANSGYECELNLITDGFQGGKNKKKGDGSSEDLNQLALRMKAALIAPSLGLSGEAATIDIDRGQKGAQAVLLLTQAFEIYNKAAAAPPSEARTKAIIVTANQVAQIGAAFPDVSSEATRLSAGMRASLPDEGDASIKGKKNTKTMPEPGTVEQVKTERDGRPVTTYKKK